MIKNYKLFGLLNKLKEEDELNNLDNYKCDLMNINEDNIRYIINEEYEKIDDNYVNILKFMDFYQYIEINKYIRYIIETFNYYTKIKEIPQGLYEKICSQKLEYKLRKIIGERFDEFKEIMEQTESIISGSFVLQCIMNKKWKKCNITNKQSDIDIYTNIELNNEIDQLDKLDKCIKKIYNSKYWNKFDSHYKINNIIQVNKYYDHIDSRNQYDIDIIYTTNNTIIKEFINNNFDIDICKSICYVKNNEFIIEINSIENIINQIFTINFTNKNNLEKTYERMHKYINRGFKLVGYNNIKELQLHMIELNNKYNIIKLNERFDIIYDELKFKTEEYYRFKDKKIFFDEKYFNEVYEKYGIFDYIYPNTSKPFSYIYNKCCDKYCIVSEFKHFHINFNSNNVNKNVICME